MPSEPIVIHAAIKFAILGADDDFEVVVSARHDDLVVVDADGLSNISQAFMLLYRTLKALDPIKVAEYWFEEENFFNYYDYIPEHSDDEKDPVQEALTLAGFENITVFPLDFLDTVKI